MRQPVRRLQSADLARPEGIVTVGGQSSLLAVPDRSRGDIDSRIRLRPKIIATHHLTISIREETERNPLHRIVGDGRALKCQRAAVIDSTATRTDAVSTDRGIEDGHGAAVQNPPARAGGTRVVVHDGAVHDPHLATPALDANTDLLSELKPVRSR